MMITTVQIEEILYCTLTLIRNKGTNQMFGEIKYRVK